MTFREWIESEVKLWEQEKKCLATDYFTRGNRLACEEFFSLIDLNKEDNMIKENIFNILYFQSFSIQNGYYSILATEYALLSNDFKDGIADFYNYMEKKFLEYI